MEINKTTAVIKTQQATNNIETKIAKPNVKQTKVDVHIGDVQMLDEANAKLNKMYEVDLEKVKQVKQAISDGKITLNLASLSKAITDEHLLGNGKDE
ncbi:hypothetical protein [Psychromonas sp. Urea-02u-13]|uniref:hypothetical protein n=1 Tax=Psychromonas sp. Urea-02u-13 TaxID=2058326 RepID=UPI0012FEE1BC|nr:hypothetical protein [Psychromonas sp. Urea-02u-13]